MSSPTHGDSRALKRNATQAGLDLVHPQPKRVKRLSFIEEEPEELDISLFAPATTESQSLSLPPLPQAAPAKSPSPDSGPPPSSNSTSPLGEIPTDEIISAEEFATFEQQRARDEHSRQMAEESVLHAIAFFKSLNGGRLNITTFKMLQDEVNESIYSEVPHGFKVEKAAATTQTEQLAAPELADAASQTDEQEPSQSPVGTANPQAEAEQLTMSSVLVNAQTQPEGPLAPQLTISAMIINATTNTDDSNTVTLIKPIYTTSGVQTDLLTVHPAPAPTPTPLPTPPPVEVDWTVLYDRELAGIRMKKPFLTGKGVIKVKVPLRRVPKSSNSKPASTPRISQATSASAPSLRRTTTNPTIHSTATSFRKPSAPAAVTPAPPSSFGSVIDLIDSDDDTPAYPTQPTSTNTGGGSSYPHNTSGAHGSYGYGSYPHNGHNNQMAEIQTDGPQYTGLPPPLPPPPPEEAPTFYGLGLYDDPKLAETLLRFQDRARDIRDIPGPTNSGRLKLHDFLEQIHADHMADPKQRIRRNLEETSWGPSQTPNVEAAIQQGWLSAATARLCYVAKGFPLVENVEFLIHGNHAKPSGDCYWRAISLSLYGMERHWSRVKAEHLAYVYHVLTHPGHDRHELYAGQLNRKFFDSSSSDTSSADGQCLPRFRANMWQVLLMAHAWTPALMQQVTADLYDICLIAFTRPRPTATSNSGSSQDQQSSAPFITETAVRGSYNARHVFLQYVNGNHFEPMCPNQHIPSEFRYPRVTVERTAKYANGPRTTSAKDGLLHPWRNDSTITVPPPVPRLNGCDVNELRRWVGSTEM